MAQNTVYDAITSLPATSEFIQRVRLASEKSSTTGRPFIVVLLQIANIDTFVKRRPAPVVAGFFRELANAIRKAVHPSQFVGRYENGLGLVFDAIDMSQLDNITNRLVLLTQSVIRGGHYNDLSSRWTDIIHQFLNPNNPGILYPRIGWSIFPRDGQSFTELIKRAQCHAVEKSS